MESDLEESMMGSKVVDLCEKYTKEEINQIREEYKRFFEGIDREKKMARDEEEVIKAAKIEEEDYNAEEMNLIAKEKMLRRCRERLMRQQTTRAKIKNKKNSKSAEEESFTTSDDDSDEEMKKKKKIFHLDEMKSLMEKAIQVNLTEVINTNNDDAKMEEDSKNIVDEDEDEDETIFPRRRGRLIRYLRRQSSKSQDSAAVFQIEFQLPMAEESSFMSYSDESDEINKASR